MSTRGNLFYLDIENDGLCQEHGHAPAFLSLCVCVLILIVREGERVRVQVPGQRV